MNRNINLKQTIDLFLKNASPEMKKFIEQHKNNPDALAEVLSDVIDTVYKKINPYKIEPVSPLTFLNDPYFCGTNKKTGYGVCDTMFPKLKDDFCIVHDPKNNYREVLCVGAIGTGKSFFMSLGLIWQLYLLSCFKNPQDYFNLSITSKISLMIISITEKQAKKNVFSTVKEAIKTIEYFKDNFYFDERKATDSLIFPNNIELFSGTSAHSSTIGLNIWSAALDEANFFKVIQQSKRSVSASGEFNEAVTLYNSLMRRQDARFLKKGFKPGHLYLASSKVYPNDFTAQKIAEIKKLGRTDAYIMDYSLWSVCREKYGDEEFKVEIGGLNKKNRIIYGDEQDITGEVISIPMEFFDKFRADIDNALRDIAGIALWSVCPFFSERSKVQEMFDPSLPKIFSVDKATLSTKSEYLLNEKVVKHTILNPTAPRYVGMDFGLTKDRFGFALGHIEKFDFFNKEYYDDDKSEIAYVKEKRPYIVIDMVLEVYPEQEMGEVDFSRVRALLFSLKNYGYKIKYVSFDGFQSVDMKQILEKKNIKFEPISMDKTTEPYECFRNAVYDGRVRCPYYEKLEIELNELEKNYVLGKVDHNVHGTKDLSDAVGSLVYNCHINSHYFDGGLLPLSVGSDIMRSIMEKPATTEQEFIEKFENEIRGGLTK